MSCEKYDVDISAIEKKIKKIKDQDFKNAFIKKLEKIMNDPYIGEKKKISNKRIL